MRRGLHEAKRVVCIGDGAEWVKNLAATHFGGAQFISDFYHVKEHVGALCRALFERGLKRLNQTRERWWDRLAQGQIQQLIHEAATHLPRGPEANKDARREVACLEKSAPFMDYARYKAEGLFIGSGVIEAGYRLFKQLAEEYADEIIRQTRREHEKQFPKKPKAPPRKKRPH